MNKDNINTSDNDSDNVNTENMLEELYLSFTEAEVEKCVKTLKKNIRTAYRLRYHFFHTFSTVEN
jgi:hypothetical protein